MSLQFDALEPRRVLATFTVSNLADSGGGSLRDAIEAANAQLGADVIEFEPGLSGTITLAGRELSIEDDLTINGPGADLLTISGNNASRVFYNHVGAITTISGLTVTGGNGDGEGYGGGGISNDGTITLVNLTVSGNSVGDFAGGGGLSNSGTMTVVDSTVSANTSWGVGTGGGGIESGPGCTLTLINSLVSGNSTGDFTGGGGISVDGPFTLTNSTVTGNISSGFGGGILIWGGTATLTDSVVSDNHAGDTGGGIENLFGTLTLINSTVSGNVSQLDDGFGSSSGGGINNYGPLTIINSTISGNSAEWGGGLATSSARVTLHNSTVVNNINGGIYTTLDEPGSVLVVSSIVARNTSIGLRADIYGMLLTPGSINNLIGDAGSAGGLVNGVDGNIVGVDPLLGPLADNGGPTETHALLKDSPAIDRGINPLALATDQRGVGREQGDGPDIGAFEWGTPSAPRGGSDGDNTHRVVSIDAFGHVLVYQEGWTFENLQEKTGAPNAIGEPIIWTDPKDGLTYVAAASESGLHLFTRSDTGGWSFRNLTTETAASASPLRDLTHFISIRRKIVVIAGITADGDVVAYQQTLTVSPSGGPAFKFVNISADLESQGQTTPHLTGLTSYVPSWDTWHLAGVDTAGRIQSIWINTNNPNFTTWRVNNLSAITGAPAIASQLAVTLTSWGGINLTGLDQTGSLLTTWWVPRFGGQWAVSNLTDMNDGPALVGGSLTSYTTPWGGINYVGIDSAGTVRVYWWVPSFGGQWAINPLLPPSTPLDQSPANGLTSSASASGTLSVYGLSPDGDVLRAWWQPGGAGTWEVENLSDIAEKV